MRQCVEMELFSYHLYCAPFHEVMTRLWSSAGLRSVPGLRHAECLLPMQLGHPVLLPGRYRLDTLALFAFWDDEAHLERFLGQPPYRTFARDGWHVRLRFYRRWGTYRELDAAIAQEVDASGPVVGVTLARLKLTETLRFARWGRPVEAQVRDHPGLVRAAVGFRPLRTFSTFSMWKSEVDMLAMVRGRALPEGTDDRQAAHRDAMKERVRRDFHHEFTTMRFVPLSEHGVWPGAPLLPAPSR